MLPYLTTTIGRLRLLGFLEGVSLLALVFIAMPLKHLFHDPLLVKILGPIHGVLFLLYLFAAVGLGVGLKWRMKTWVILLLGSLLPFGTFYVDKQILSRIQSGAA